MNSKRKFPFPNNDSIHTSEKKIKKLESMIPDLESNMKASGESNDSYDSGDSNDENVQSGNKSFFKNIIFSFFFTSDSFFHLRSV